MLMNMVELKGVTKRFDGHTAVSGVDLEIRAGEFLTLLGPSGCGKTTLLRMISGFETPTEGAIFLEGVDVTDVPPYRRNVNQVFQSYALFPHLSVWDNVCFGLKMKKVPKAEMEERVGQALEMVAMGGMEKRKPSALSGGQRQRVALARAIVCRPKVLLLDEPLSALETKLRQNMQIELKRLQQKLGITFVFVTHDQEEALTMSDRIAVVNKGRIEQIGGASEIYHSPRTTFVANFIGEANIFTAEVIAQTPDAAKVLLEGKIELEVNGRQLPENAKSVLISIRPEKVHVAPKCREGRNWFEATVQEEIFRGATDTLHLQTEAGVELVAVVANESALELSVHKGDRIGCYLHPEDVVVVRD